MYKLGIGQNSQALPLSSRRAPSFHSYWHSLARHGRGHTQATYLVITPCHSRTVPGSFVHMFAVVEVTALLGRRGRSTRREFAVVCVHTALTHSPVPQRFVCVINRKSGSDDRQAKAQSLYAWALSEARNFARDAQYDCKFCYCCQMIDHYAFECGFLRLMWRKNGLKG